MQPIPPLDGLSWTKVRALARELAAAPAEAVTAALPPLGAPDPPQRMLGVYLLGYAAAAIRRLAALRRDPSEYVRHSAGNALRDIRRAHPVLVDAETATWDLGDPAQRFTYDRVLRAR
jgi:HEAT repeat protein